MTPTKRYIHVRNWDRFQHRDVTRAKDGAAAWIKDYTGQAHDDDWIALTFAERGLLTTIRIEYGCRKGKGLPRDTAELGRLFRQRVLEKQIVALSDAGFIEVSASRRRAAGQQTASLEERRGEEIRQELAPAAREPVEKSSKEEPSSSSSAAAHDDLWDTLEQLFGPVVDGTSAHGKRNKACADLRRQGATSETVKRAHDRWPKVFQGASATDMAISTHYPLLVGSVHVQAPKCPECGTGGGLHIAGCSRTAAA